MADSKLSTFLTTNKLNLKRLLAVSHNLETLTRADRGIKLAKRKVKGADAPPPAVEGAPKPEKPRSGRAITPRALAAALAGTPLSGPTKQRILRAVNEMLVQKKKDKVEFRTLF